MCHLRLFVSFKLDETVSKQVDPSMLFMHFSDLSSKYSPGGRFGQFVERSRRGAVVRGEDKAVDAFPLPCSRSMEGWTPEDMNWD